MNVFLHILSVIVLALFVAFLILNHRLNLKGDESSKSTVNNLIVLIVLMLVASVTHVLSCAIAWKKLNHWEIGPGLLVVVVLGLLGAKIARIAWQTRRK